jgi:hypothetical protein
MPGSGAGVIHREANIPGITEFLNWEAWKRVLDIVFREGSLYSFRSGGRSGMAFGAFARGAQGLGGFCFSRAPHRVCTSTNIRSNLAGHGRDMTTATFNERS